MFYISHVILKNFRCFKNKSIRLSKKINVLVGKNAIGKTSIAEAIYYTGCCKSPRTSLDKELIKKDEEYFIIELSTVTDGEEDRLKIINNLTLDRKTFPIPPHFTIYHNICYLSINS